MPLKRKIITIAFLSLGFVVIGIGIARLLWLLDAFKGKTDSYSVTSAYSAIESSVAIIGTSGPTVKFILSRCIPWLQPSFERSTTAKNSGNAYSGAYGNNSNTNGTRRTRNGGVSGYDDLDSISAEHQDVEMKGDWRRRSDAHSDEQRITSGEDQRGIVKSVDWTVHPPEDSHLREARTRPDAGDRTLGGRPAARPTDIL